MARPGYIKQHKPSAADRTIGLFSGSTKVDEISKLIKESEDAKEHGKVRETITQESIDNELKHYMRRGDKPLSGWRLTAGPNSWHLERLRDNGTTYSGLLLSSGDISELLELFSSAKAEIAYANKRV